MPNRFIDYGYGATADRDPVAGNGGYNPAAIVNPSDYRARGLLPTKQIKIVTNVYTANRDVAPDFTPPIAGTYSLILLLTFLPLTSSIQLLTADDYKAIGSILYAQAQDAAQIVNVVSPKKPFIIPPLMYFYAVCGTMFTNAGAPQVKIMDITLLGRMLNLDEVTQFTSR